MKRTRVVFRQGTHDAPETNSLALLSVSSRAVGWEAAPDRSAPSAKVSEARNIKASSRTASALGTANQTNANGQADAYGQSNSTQYSQLTVTGTPSATDNLVFHFLTSQSETGNVNSNSGYGFWNLTVAGGTDNPVFDQQTAGGSLLSSGATQTSQGFDFTMPFTPTSGLFKYNFTVDAQGYVTGQASGNTTQTGSISAMLAGIDVVNGSGALISSASFDQGGFGAITTAPSVGPPPTTVPEPSSMALLATGLASLVGFPRFRRKRS